VFRGAETNLTERFRRCLEAAGEANHVVRVKGDQPFVDPRIIDEAVRLARMTGAAYAGNRVDPNFPKGLEVEVARVDALTDAAEGLDLASAETTSPLAVLRGRPDRYPHARLAARRDWSRLDLRVKTHPDLAFARAVYAALYPADPAFGMEDVLDLLGSRQDISRLAAA
jgi:spore coat polysaccharide biosynthesis protein SpsF